jgi:hypothetical protein
MTTTLGPITTSMMSTSPAPEGSTLEATLLELCRFLNFPDEKLERMRAEYSALDAEAQRQYLRGEIVKLSGCSKDLIDEDLNKCAQNTLLQYFFLLLELQKYQNVLPEERMRERLEKLFTYTEGNTLPQNTELLIRELKKLEELQRPPKSNTIWFIVGGVALLVVVVVLYYFLVRKKSSLQPPVQQEAQEAQEALLQPIPTTPSAPTTPAAPSKRVRNKAIKKR